MPARALWPHDAAPDDERERKYLPEADAAEAFWRIASGHLRPEHAGGAVLYAWTTYFDTADLAYYRSSDGPVRRRLRVREYALAPGLDATPVLGERCYLELKQCRGDVRTKTRVALWPGELARHLSSLEDAPVEPWVATWYRRRVLVDEGERLRLTLDDHLVLCRPRPIGGPLATLDEADLLGRGPPCVLEYKSRAPPPPWLVRALAGLRQAADFSKFMLGMSAVAAAGAIPRAPRQAVAAR